MKTIKVSASRAAADLDSLFTGRGTTALLPAVRLDGGKYKWLGRASAYAGREVQVPDDVLAVWMVRKADKDGPYAAAYCVEAP